MISKKAITIFTLILTLTSLNPVTADEWDVPDGVTEDAIVEKCGQEVNTEYTDIPGCAGELHTLTNAQYKKMWGKINKFKEENGRLPKYVNVKDMKVGVDTITQAQYRNMEKRWNTYKTEHNGKEPTNIGIEGSIGSVKNTAKVGPIQKKLMDAVGAFSTFTGFYNLCKGRGYGFYIGDCRAQDAAIKKLKNKDGINCVDSAQLGYALAKEMEYEVKFQRTLCKLKSGKYVGHVFLKVKGGDGEFNDWTYIDLAACLGNSYKIGNHWGAKNKPVTDLPDNKWGTDDGKKCQC